MSLNQTAKVLERLSTPSVERSRDAAVAMLFHHQLDEGYWWYTLEANETIGAGILQVLHFLGDADLEMQTGLARRLLSEQRPDGSWGVFFEGPGDLSSTIECYFALRLAGHSPAEGPLTKAREFILGRGGLTKARVFTRIHLALFGIVPWTSCPSMPIWFASFPAWLGLSIYEFSSWARASIVPLLLLDAARPVKPIDFDLGELYLEPEGERVFRFPKPKSFWSLQNVFIHFDKVLKLLEKLPWHPGKNRAIQKAEQWTREHIARTEDIYPAMAYAVLGLSALGYPKEDPTIQKALSGLKRFQQTSAGSVHQQCCISPNWDTPWAATALLEAGASPSDPRLLKAARYMLSKEVKDFAGDWKFKNPGVEPGGWAFEFQNDCFPDVDDTIQALHMLKRTALPDEEKAEAIRRGLNWILSMQCDNGGWAAFDKNNVSDWVNKIPFSDHGACLDPPTPDITGRMLELLPHFGFQKNSEPVRRALSFLWKTQEPCGAWRGRWGVNFIYGTWCVLTGLAAINEHFDHPVLQAAVNWLKSIQNPDGGWGESCLSDAENRYIPLALSIPSQTAWAVMALVAAGERESPAVQRAIDWLVQNQNSQGSWDESYFTGTGFPGHFYIRYHGYRHYFPLLALARYGTAKTKR